MIYIWIKPNCLERCKFGTWICHYIGAWICAVAACIGCTTLLRYGRFRFASTRHIIIKTYCYIIPTTHSSYTTHSALYFRWEIVRSRTIACNALNLANLRNNLNWVQQYPICTPLNLPLSATNRNSHNFCDTVYISNFVLIVTNSDINGFSM
jgi:hypothetical protein